MGRHEATSQRGTGGRSRWEGARRSVVLTAVAVMGVLSATAVALAGPAPTGVQLVEGTPCTATARACADLDEQRAWLIQDGRVVRGPVRMHSGGPGAETPPGTFRVEWKHDDHISGESGVAMPHSVFFAPGGIAFHQGDTDSASAGCIRLDEEDAQAFFDFLQVGDEVQVVG